MAIGKMKAKTDKSGGLLLICVLVVFNFVAELIAYSDVSLRNNAAVVEYCRTSMAALSGGTAGLLGLTGFYGFGFYLFAVFGLWVSCGEFALVLLIFWFFQALLLLKAGSDWEKYFVNRKSLLTGGFIGGLFVS